nr:EOG090X0266 [Eulimnadia texana]
MGSIDGDDPAESDRGRQWEPHAQRTDSSLGFLQPQRRKNILKTLNYTVSKSVHWAVCTPYNYDCVLLSIVLLFTGNSYLSNHQRLVAVVVVLVEVIDTITIFIVCNIIVNLFYICCKSEIRKIRSRNAWLHNDAAKKLADVYIEEMFRHDKALGLLTQLLTQTEIKSNLFDLETYNKLMNRISCEFNEDSSQHKFELCKTIVVLLFACPPVDKSKLLNQDWPSVLMKTVAEILCSKIGAEQRDPAIQLVSRLLEIAGMDWCVSSSENSRQFLLLLVNLACVEIRMKLEERTLDEALENVDILVACYTIVELFIGFMMSPLFLDFDQKQREQVYCALKGAVTVVLETLMNISQRSESGSCDWNPADRQTHFVCATIRVLGSWLSEETSSMHEAICEVLPFVLSFCSKLFELRKNLTNGEEVPEALRFLLPALCHLVTEDSTRKVLIAQKTHELLYDYLEYQWKLFSDWLKEQPEVPADWLHTDNDENIEYPRPDSQTALILICGIFMNYVVLETKLASEDVVFSKLLKFCFNKVPELNNKQNLIVLFGNVAVLGLLILRHHSWKIREGDSTVFRYIQGTVSFLWDAYNSEESCDASCLVISLRYKKDWPDLAELWFLGMQSLSNVLANLTWIVDFIIDSGWPQEILKTLAKITPGAIDANTRTAYEDFLCCLVRADPKAKMLVKEKGGRFVCKSHSMKELQILLDARN